MQKKKTRLSDFNKINQLTKKELKKIKGGTSKIIIVDGYEF